MLNHGTVVHIPPASMSTTSAVRDRILTRGGADEPPPGRGGSGASSGAGDLLEFFVESVRLLATVCEERHALNIALVRSHKGTSYKVRAMVYVMSSPS